MKRMTKSLLLSSILFSSIYSADPKPNSEVKKAEKPQSSFFDSALELIGLKDEIIGDPIAAAIKKSSPGELERALVAKAEPITAAQKKEYLENSERIIKKNKANTLDRFKAINGIRAAIGLAYGVIFVATAAHFFFSYVDKTETKTNFADLDNTDKMIASSGMLGVLGISSSMFYNAVTNHDAKQKLYKALHVHNLLNEIKAQA